MKPNCLTYVFDKMAREGGYMVVRKSANWGLAHAMHLSRDGKLTHYVPPNKMARPWHAIKGFDGVILHDDPDEARPIRPMGIIASALVMLVLGVVWAMARCRGG